MRLNVQQRGGGCIARSKDPQKLILEALERTGGVIYYAAHELGVHRETLRLWINRLGLKPDVARIRKERREAKFKALHPRPL